MFESLFKKYDRIIFFDTETTGFDSDKDDQIIELAAVCMGKDGSEESFDDFIQLHTKAELPDEIIKLTGITDLQLATQGIPEEDAIRKLINMMEPWDAFVNGNTLLVAHNAQFDLMFFCYAILRHKKKNPGWLRVFNDADYLDTLTVYRDRHKFPHRLENAIEQYGLGTKVENSHRAVDDCRALFEVAKAMEAEKDDLAGYINIFGYPAKYGVSGRKLKKVTYLEQSFSNYSGKTLPEQLSRKQ